LDPVGAQSRFRSTPGQIQLSIERVEMVGDVWLLVVEVAWDDEVVLEEDVEVTGDEDEELEVETELVAEDVLGVDVDEMETTLEEEELEVVVVVVEGLVAK
jgi:hypothetical protein